MEAIIRVDSSGTIGTGHMIRCLSLAKVLARNNYKITFICNDNNFIETVKEHYNIYILPQTTYLDWKTDSKQCIEIMKKSTTDIDVLIVDHYSLNYKWETVMKEYTRILLTIDDLERRHTCDILLDQNIYSYIPYTTSIYNKLLVGTKYVILNDKYSTIERKLHNGIINRIHICFGGSDMNNQTGKVIDCLLDSNITNIMYDVVIGRSNPNLEVIKEQVKDNNNFNVYYDIDNMQELLLQADICIGATGTSAYERCYIGLSTIVITIADNQLGIAKALEERGVAKHIGHIEWRSEDLISAIKYNINNPNVVIEASERCKRVVDGMGTQQIIDELKKLN